MSKLQSRHLGTDTRCEDDPTKLANLWGLWLWCGDWKVLWIHITARVFSGMVICHRPSLRSHGRLLERLGPSHHPSQLYLV